jgi:hypothetical protein
MHSRLPSENRGHGECRAPDAPAAARGVKNTRVSHHGHTGNTRHSPRDGFNGFLRALPGDRACLPPSSPRSSLLEGLMPASGHQNHTTSPSASRAFVLPRQSVHRIPHPTFVTIAKRPSNGYGTARDIEVICRRRERIYFFKWDWTGSISMIRFRKSAFRRKSDQPDGSASAAPLA